MSEVTRRQIEYAVRREFVHYLQPDKNLIFSGGDISGLYSRQALQLLSQGKHVLVDAGGRREDLSGDRISDTERSGMLQSFLSRFTSEVTENALPRDIGGLVVTGGETAITVCSGLDASGIRMCGEIEPLVPVGTLIGGQAESLPVVTKAGGFGTEAVFEKACLYLSRLR
jgi:uncharacterized protein YgbK (DUF1537 family)